MSCGIPATILAPPGNSRRNARQPALDGASTEPGTRKHSRPCSSAHDAVIRAPLRAGASTTTVASASPLMIRFRRGNVPVVGASPAPSSETTAPPAVDDRIRQPGVRSRVEMPWPPPMTATVVPPASRVAAWAAPSIPIASPETTRRARRDEGRRDPGREARPASVARRVPTMATAAPARARPGRRARTAGAAAGRSRRAATGTPGPRRSRSAGRARGSARGSAPRPARPRAIASATSGARARRPPAAVRLGVRPSRDERGAIRRRTAPSWRISRADPNRRSRLANPTGPSPCDGGQDCPGVAFVVARPMDHGFRPSASVVSPARRDRRRAGPRRRPRARQRASARREPHAGRRNQAASSRWASSTAPRRRGPRSSARPGAVARSHVRSPRSSSASSTTRRSAAASEAARRPQRRPVSRPLTRIGPAGAPVRPR